MELDYLWLDHLIRSIIREVCLMNIQSKCFDQLLELHIEDIQLLELMIKIIFIKCYIKFVCLWASLLRSEVVLTESFLFNIDCTNFDFPCLGINISFILYIEISFFFNGLATDFVLVVMIGALIMFVLYCSLLMLDCSWCDGASEWVSKVLSEFGASTTSASILHHKI